MIRTALLLLFALAAPLARAQAPEPIVEAIPDPVTDAMVRGDWAGALDALATLDAERPEAAELWLYLRAVALDHDGRRDDALAALERLEERFPDGDWIHKARFRRAELLREAGRMAEAEAIWEAASERVSSDARKRALAELYLRFADELSTAPEADLPDRPLDYERAHALYAKALELDAPRDVQDRALWRMGICREEQGRWREAASTWSRYLERFDPSREGGEAALQGAGARVVEARQKRGAALLALGSTVDARRAFEDLLAILDDARDGREPWRALFGEVGTDERARALRACGDAAYAIAATWPRGNADETPLAIAALERFLDAFPDHPQAVQAAFDVAEMQRELGRGDEALAAFAAFLERDPPAGATADEREAAARLAQRALYLTGQVHLDRAEFDRAAEVWGRYVALHPTGADWSAAQRGLVEAEYERAAWLDREERRADARAAWARFLEDHPLDARAEAIQLRIGEILHAEGRAAAEAGDGAAAAEAWRAAVAQWRRLVAKYPRTETASQALFRIGQTHEEDLAELESAIAAYRECDFGGWAGRAMQRLEVMTKPALAVRTERSWRTNEPARVRVDVRNVETLQVELYALDLEAYFRKHLTHRSVETLDIDLIAADRRFEVAVAGYEPHAPIRQDVDLAVDGPGVWAVVVEAEELRATTLVIRSDLDVVAKSSRREVFVWAQDRLSGRPAEGARVLVAVPGAEGPTVEELETDADGVARLALDVLAGGPDVRVFAVRDGHCASDGLSLGGVRLAPGLAPRGFVYSDRPAYQPGQTAHWRAVLREVEDGQYTFRPGRRYRVDVLDPRGRIVRREALELSEFGTLHGAVALGTEAVEGRWRVRCQAGDDPAFEGAFEVARYTLRHVELTATPERPVWYRGETVAVDVAAAWYYGEPLAGAALGVQLPDGRQIELETDAEGRARFTFPTRDYAHGGQLAFRAWLPAEGVQADGSVWLAVRGYALAVDAARDVVLSGEEFDVDVAATLPDGAPAAGRPVAVRVSRLARRTEVQVERRELETDAEGAARARLSLERGGWYVVRAEGTDRFGNPVVAETRVQVSDEDDDVRLRILADTGVVQVGGTAAVRLVNRTGPGLALVTWEAEGVLGYRLVELEDGANELTFDVEHAHAPGVVLAAARLAGDRLHSAATRFRVERELHVTVTPERGTLAPRETCAVAIAVTDAAGRPVEAELSLAAVDEALFDLYPSFDPAALQPLFDAGRREAGGVVTVSSADFRYDGVTTAVDAEILAERLREEADKAWEDRRVQTLEALGQLERVDGADDFFLGKAQRAPASLATPQRARAEVVGVGGGAGGRFAGRAGGRRALAGDDPEALRERFAETAFWTPAIRTDADGRARVELAMPDQATRWRLTAVGAARTPLFGGGTATVVTERELFVELSLPGRLVEGDAPRVLARVHDATGAPGTARLVLRVGPAAAEGTEGTGPLAATPVELELSGAGVVEHLFPALEPVAGPSPLVFEAEVVAETGGRTRRDAVRRTLAVEPWGLEHAASKSGPVASDATFEIELPGPAGGLRDRRLEVTVGPGLHAELVDVALGRHAWPTRRSLPYPPTRATAAAELLGVANVLRWLGARGDVDPAIVSDLRARAEGLAAELVLSQRDDGGWSWIGATKLPGAEVSGLAMLALAHAADVGVGAPQDTVERGLAHLAAAFQAAPQEDDEQKALLALALAAHDRGDFGALNRLHRRRASLSPAALSYTALALVETGRAPMAAELTALLEERAVIGADAELVQGAACRWPGDRNGPWNRSTVESTAWALMAIQAVSPRSERAAEAAAWLAGRVAWAPDRARGIALAALARHETQARFVRGPVRAVVSVDGRRVGERTFEPGALAPLEVAVELDDEAAPRARVDVAVEGAGELFVRAVMRGFAPGAEPPEPPRDLRVTRHRHLAAPPRHDGRELPHGFGVLTRHEETWENEVSSLAQGGALRARLEFWTDGTKTDAERDFLALEIPLPAGADVLDGSVTGRALAHEVRGGRLLVHLGQHRGSGWVEYTLVGARPGAWRALPARIESLLEPGRRAYGEPLALGVLPRGEKSRDPYRPTPDELYHRGKALFDDGRRAEAWEPLSALNIEYGDRLRTDVLTDTARMLLYLAIERGESRAVVRAFEVLREKSPDLTIPFDEVRAVGAAYRDLEEWERALLVFRATVEETFGKDLKVAGALEEQGERSGAIDVMAGLWREYPDLPTVTEASLALSEKMLVAAPTAHTDESLRRAGRDRAALGFEGILLLRRFLALFPRDPLAPEAGLNLVSALLDLEDHERAARVAGELAAVYTEPRYADAFLYSRAVAEWYLGNEDTALELLRGIATAAYPDELGEPRPSENRDLARYILGQIWHARRDVDRASEYYAEVEDLFADAKEALAGFRRRSVALPELTTVVPGETATLELEHKNVAEVELLVYGVDLLTLALREKNLTNVTAVNLAGIAPAIRRTVTLPAGSRLRPATAAVELELTEPGAYLAICRAGEQFASGLVLVSDLEIGVREDAAAGRLRIEAWSRADGRFLRDVDVRVIGTGNERFQTGRTDPRGLWVADGLLGTTTVIARLDDRHYAFHRGRQPVGAVEAGAQFRYKNLEQQDYLRNVFDLNRANQAQRAQWLEDEIRRERKGVKVEQVK